MKFRKQRGGGGHSNPKSFVADFSTSRKKRNIVFWNKGGVVIGRFFLSKNSSKFETPIVPYRRHVANCRGVGTIWWWGGCSEGGGDWGQCLVSITPLTTTLPTTGNKEWGDPMRGERGWNGSVLTYQTITPPPASYTTSVLINELKLIN